MNKVDWPCRVESGRLIVPDREQFLSAVAECFGSMNPVSAMLTVEKLGRSRTAAQLRYLWGVVYSSALRDESLSGRTKDDLHDYFKGQYLKRTVELHGNIVDTVGSTTRLDTNGMTEFIEHVRRELAEMGIYTPDPGEEAL